MDEYLSANLFSLFLLRTRSRFFSIFFPPVLALFPAALRSSTHEREAAAFCQTTLLCALKSNFHVYVDVQQQQRHLPNVDICMCVWPIWVCLYGSLLWAPIFPLSFFPNTHPHMHKCKSRGKKTETNANLRNDCCCDPKNGIKVMPLSPFYPGSSRDFRGRLLQNIADFLSFFLSFPPFFDGDTQKGPRK